MLTELYLRVSHPSETPPTEQEKKKECDNSGEKWKKKRQEETQMLQKGEQLPPELASRRAERLAKAMAQGRNLKEKKGKLKEENKE